MTEQGVFLVISTELMNNRTCVLYSPLLKVTRKAGISGLLISTKSPLYRELQSGTAKSPYRITRLSTYRGLSPCRPSYPLEVGTRDFWRMSNSC